MGSGGKLGARLLCGAAAPPHRRHGGARVRAPDRLRRAAYVGVPRAVVEQMMQQEAMRVRLHGQPAAEPPYADFFAWAGQPAAARGGGGG